MERKKLNTGLITTVSGRWPRELPAARDQEYGKWLQNNCPEINIIRTEGLAVNNQDIEVAAAYFKTQAVDLVIVLLGAFTGDYAATYLAEELKVPVILWAPYEPPFDGGRLMANSLVAATMNAAALHRLGHKFHFVYGSHTDERVAKEVTQYLKVYDVIKRLKHTFLGLLGYRPTAFYSSTFDETLIRQKFGIKMEEFDLKPVFDRMAELDKAALQNDMEKISKEVRIEGLPEGHLENHSRLYLTLNALIKEQGFDAVTIKCWPEMGNLKTTPCAVLSRLADEGFVIGCESDVDATISMIIQNNLTNSPVFMSDLISIDEKENAALFWHCGQAARKLRDPRSDIKMGNHPLAGQGTVFETTLKPGKVTIARISKIGDRYKLFLVKGEAVPTQKEVKGVMVKVVLEEPVRKVLYRIAEEGVPHHYSIVWDDVADEMKLMCKLMDIEVIAI
jgi:L-fucose isomerase-like protein